MPRLAACTVALALAPAAAFAQAAEPAAPDAAHTLPAALDKVFTGALVSTYPDGEIAKMWVARDGTFKGLTRHGNRNAGKWDVEGPKVCMRQTAPIWIPFHRCTTLPATLDKPWPEHAITGEPVTISFAPGDHP